MRDFGFGKSSLEARIQQEAREFVEYATKQNGRPFDPQSACLVTTSNVMCTLTFGKRYCAVTVSLNVSVFIFYSKGFLNK